MELGLGPRDIVFYGDPLPLPKKGAEPGLPIFGPCLLWLNGWMDQNDTWHGGRSRPRPNCARSGPSSPPPKRAQPPHFSANVYCGQTAGWIKMSLGIEIGLDPGHIVLDGDPAPPEKAAQPPTLRPCLLWPNGWTDQDGTWHVGRPRHRPHCARWGLGFPKKAQPQIFCPCLLWPNVWMDQDTA